MTVLDDLRYAAGLLRKSPGFTMLAVTALALGIGANCAIFSVVNAVLLTPLPFADPQHLYEISSTDASGRISGISLADFVDLGRRGGAFSKLAVDRTRNFTLTGGNGDAESVFARSVSKDCFPLLGVPALQGRTFLEDDFRPDSPRVAVLGYRLWQ